MTRPTNLSLTQRNRLDQRLTFDSTTPNLKTAARPVNPVERKDVSSKSLQLANALGIASEGITQTMGLMEQNARLDVQEGMFLAQKGEDKPTKGESLIEGYETMEGELHARRFEQEAQQFYAENYNKLNPKEFNEGLKALSQKYLEDAPSDFYLKGFLPAATQAEEKLLGNYNLDMAQEFQKESLNMTSELIADEIYKNIEGSLGVSLDTLPENPMEYIQASLTIGDSGLDKVLRESLTNIQEKAKGLNLSKQAVSTLFVEQIGQIAVESGMPELLDFTAIEDASKIRLETNPGLMADIKNYRNKAEANRDSILVAQDRKIKEENDKERQIKLNRLTTSIGNAALIEDPKERLDLALELETLILEDELFASLPNSQFKLYHDRIMDIKEGINSFRNETVAPTYINLRQKARAGELSDTELMENISDLTQSDYEKLSTMIDNTRELEADAEEKKQIQNEKAAAKRADNWFFDMMPRVVNQLQEIRGFKAQFEGDTDDALELRFIRDYDAMTEEKGAPLTKEEIDQLVIDPIIQAESKYNTIDELSSKEGFTEEADPDARPVNTIQSGVETLEEAEDKVDGFIKKGAKKTYNATLGNLGFLGFKKMTIETPDNVLPEGFSRESFSVDRQTRGIQLMNKAVDVGHTYSTITEQLANSDLFDEVEAEAYRDMYFYNLGLNMLGDDTLDGRKIMEIRDELLELEVPEELIKTILMDLK